MKIAENLKNDTRLLHSSLETALNSEKIFSDSFGRDDLMAILLVLYIFHLSFEDQVFRSLKGRGESFVGRSRIHYLRKDIEFMDPGLEVLPYGGNVEIDAAAALGWLYVMEGSALGGNVIMKKLRGRHSFRDFPFNYYSAYSDNIGRFWQEFTSRINQEPEGSYGAILAGATDAYTNLINLTKK